MRPKHLEALGLGYIKKDLYDNYRPVIENRAEGLNIKLLDAYKTFSCR